MTLRVLNCVVVVNETMCPVAVEHIESINIDHAWIQTKEGIMCKEERTSEIHSEIKLHPTVLLAVEIGRRILETSLIYLRIYRMSRR